MQAGGQCGVSEVHQFMVGRSAGSGGHAHMFSHSGHDVAAVTPSSHSHSHHSQQQQQHHQQNHQSQHHQQQQMLQQQQQRHQLGLDPDSPKLPSPAVAARQSPNSNYIKPLVITRDSLAADDEGMEEGDRSIGGNRWPRQETLALIKIRTDMDASFRDASLKGPLWEDVSRKLEELGFHRSAKKCKEKFENVHKYYKKTKEGKGGRQDGKSYRFFSQLEALYGGGHGGGGGDGSMQATSKGAGGNSSRAPKAAAGGVGGSAQIFSDQIMDEFNVSSESWEDQEYEDPEEPESKKRKRKAASTWTSCSYEVAAFEGLVRKMMEKQEVMQRKLLEVIDRREHERVMRENAWRRQEMARISREQELRTQERSRAASMDAALVTFLQKVTGQTLHLPHCIPTPPPATATAPGSHDAPPPHHPSASKHEEAAAQFDDDPQDKEVHMDPNSNRWPRSEVLSLIRLRSGMEAKFQESGPKAPLWEAISAAMASLGYNRSTKRCKEKWENINKYFRKTKESSKKRPENAKTCPYFHQLDALYKTGVLNSPTGKLAPKLELDQTNEMLDRHDHTARKDSGQAQAEEEMLALIPSAEDAPLNEVAINGTSSAVPALSIMFTAQEDGSVVDRSVNTASTTKMNEKQSDIIDDGRPTGSGGMSFDQRFPGHHEKPLKQLEGLVKEMMEQHHQLQQQSSDEFELSVDDQTQAENKSHDDHDQWQQQQDNFKLRSSAHDQARSNPKDAALIALVHKLAGQAPEHFPSISDLST